MARLSLLAAPAHHPPTSLMPALSSKPVIRCTSMQPPRSTADCSLQAVFSFRHPFRCLLFS